MERYEKLVLDTIECSYDDQGNILPDALAITNQTVKIYADYLKAKAMQKDADSKVESAKIQAEANVQIAQIQKEMAEIESGSRIESAKIQADATIEEAKARALSSGIDGGIGAIIDIVKTVANTVNLKSVVWAEESANKIVSSKYLGFIKKQP